MELLEGKKENSVLSLMFKGVFNDFFYKKQTENNEIKVRPGVTEPVKLVGWTG